jgi:hypothetical protein
VEGKADYRSRIVHRPAKLHRTTHTAQISSFVDRQIAALCIYLSLRTYLDFPGPTSLASITSQCSHHAAVRRGRPKAAGMW